MTIKVIAFEVDNVIWRGHLDQNTWGKGPTARPTIEDNLETVSDVEIRDRSYHANHITLFPDVPDIIHDIVKNGIKLAIVSRNRSAALSNRALWFYKAQDANYISKPIISFVAYNEHDSRNKVDTFSQIKSWSQAPYDEMVYFDCHKSSKEVHDTLGVHFHLVSEYEGIHWDAYQRAVQGGSSRDGDSRHDIPYYGQPALGKLIGEGKFAKVYHSADDPQAVVKVLKYWTTELRHRFLEIYEVIKSGRPFHDRRNNDDEYLLMTAMEVRNLDMVHQLKAPKPPMHFSGWLTMTKVEGTPLWKTPLYKKHPFSVTFQRLVKKAFHLIIDEIETFVKRYGIEHRDGHLANAFFTMSGDQPEKAHLLDFGIAVRMTWDGSHYIRGNDVLVWSDSEAGKKYTPEEFRRYWITWMVKTEYEANWRRNDITEQDGKRFLQDLEWWYHR